MKEKEITRKALSERVRIDDNYTKQDIFLNNNILVNLPQQRKQILREEREREKKEERERARKLEDAKNRPNIDWQEKIQGGILRGLRNICETP